jgi:hypothetical protein
VHNKFISLLIGSLTFRIEYWGYAVSDFEVQIQDTGKLYDEAIRTAEQKDNEILYSVVAGSRLHEIIHNPIDSRIDEGQVSRSIPPSLNPQKGIHHAE